MQIKIHIQAIRKQMQNKEVEVVCRRSERQLGNLLPKALSREKFQKFGEVLDVKENKMVIRQSVKISLVFKCVHSEKSNKLILYKG